MIHSDKNGLLSFFRDTDVAYQTQVILLNRLRGGISMGKLNKKWYYYHSGALDDEIQI
jgi:hypothetical protein